MTSPARGREAWLVAGQELLRRGGVGAVKLRALTEELGLTTGSFYHHFTGMAPYLDELARYYGADQVEQGTEALAGAEPRERLRRFYQRSVDDRMGLLDAAMRDWAGSNAVAAEAVRAADTVVLRFIERAFADLGYPAVEAQVRAQLLLSVGVARIRPPWRVPGDPFDTFLEVLAPLDGPPDQAMSSGRSPKPNA